MKPHSLCSVEPDGKTTISYDDRLRPDPRQANKRPWHKHTLPNRRRR